jgi:hypothetical protein
MRRCHITAPFSTDLPLTLARDVYALSSRFSQEVSFRSRTARSQRPQRVGGLLAPVHENLQRFLLC